MVKCDKVKLFKGKATKDGYVNMVVLEELGEVVVTKKQYRDIGMGDIVSLNINTNGEYSINKIFKRIISRDKIKLLKSKYETINLCEK